MLTSYILIAASYLGSSNVSGVKILGQQRGTGKGCMSLGELKLADHHSHTGRFHFKAISLQWALQISEEVGSSFCLCHHVL